VYDHAFIYGLNYLKCHTFFRQTYNKLKGKVSPVPDHHLTGTTPSYLGTKRGDLFQVPADLPFIRIYTVHSYSQWSTIAHLAKTTYFKETEGFSNPFTMVRHWTRSSVPICHNFDSRVIFESNAIAISNASHCIPPPFHQVLITRNAEVWAKPDSASKHYTRTGPLHLPFTTSSLHPITAKYLRKHCFNALCSSPGIYFCPVISRFILLMGHFKHLQVERIMWTWLLWSPSAKMRLQPHGLLGNAVLRLACFTLAICTENNFNGSCTHWRKREITCLPF
jgi:hypothetical protein